MLKLLPILLLLASLVLNGILLKDKLSGPKVQEYKVTRIVDGDTFVAGDKTVRLYGVDAPEPSKCGGKEATDKLSELVLDKDVELRDVANDRYGRVLANVYRNGEFVNLSLLKSGWAVYVKEYSSGDEILAKNASYPKDQKLGLFSATCTQFANPTNIKCNIKGNINAHNDVKTYHFPGCGGQEYDSYPVELYRGDQWFCTEKEAQKAGFAKSKNCFDLKYGE